MKPSEIARLREVHRIGKDRAGEIAETLSQAFRQDEFFSWLRKDPQRLDVEWWESLIKILPTFSIIHALGDISAVSLWGASDELSIDLIKESTFDQPEQGSQAEEEFLKITDEHFGEKAEVFMKMHEMAPKEPYWYLAAIGVCPKYFGQGRGTQILQTMLEHLDEVKLPAYLEATNTQNASLYSRHGFELLEEVSIMGSPTLHRMWRSPK